MNDIFFVVPGVAVPKGSRSVYRGRSVESSKRWPEWKERVQAYAIEARAKRRYDRMTGPVTLTVSFYLPKPQRKVHEHHIKRPDLDKLVRGVCDALTGIVWLDDSQVDTIMATKRYVDFDTEMEVPGVAIRIAASIS